MFLYHFNDLITKNPVELRWLFIWSVWDYDLWQLGVCGFPSQVLKLYKLRIALQILSALVGLDMHAMSLQDKMPYLFTHQSNKNKVTNQQNLWGPCQLNALHRLLFWTPCCHLPSFYVCPMALLQYRSLSVHPVEAYGISNQTHNWEKDDNKKINIKCG